MIQEKFLQKKNKVKHGNVVKIHVKKLKNTINME